MGRPHSLPLWALFPRRSWEGNGSRAPRLLGPPENGPDGAAGLGVALLRAEPEPGVCVGGAGPQGLPLAGSGSGERGVATAWLW